MSGIKKKETVCALKLIIRTGDIKLAANRFNVSESNLYHVVRNAGFSLVKLKRIRKGVVLL